MKTKLLEDHIFKAIYGEHPEVLKSFLDAFFQHIHKMDFFKEVYEEVPIQKCKYKRKSMRGDLLVVLNHCFISIEAFGILNETGIKKTIAYLSRIYGNQLKNKEEYKKSKKVIGIIIADRISPRKLIEEKWFSKYQFQNEKQTILTEEIEIYVLRLDEIRKMKYYEGESDMLWKHLRMMGAKSNKERRQIGREKIFMTISDYYCDYMNDRETNEIFSIENKTKYIYLEEGEKRGLKKGEKLGLKKGQQQEKIKIAQNLIKENMPVLLISKSTGLKVEEIEAIAKKGNIY